jgi:hypothetical protein
MDLAGKFIGTRDGSLRKSFSPEPGDDSQVTITLSKAEALVIFDLLAEFREEPSIAVRHEADRKAIWTAILEKRLAEPFLSNYDRILAKARRTLLKS